jgi:hypothetical protein
VLPLPELDPFVSLQVQSGVLFSLPVRLAVMERSRCHWNVEELWRRKKLLAVFSGYALSEDGLWRGHSWGVRGASPRSRHIVETTEARQKYFGIALAAKGFPEGLRLTRLCGDR